MVARTMCAVVVSTPVLSQFSEEWSWWDFGGVLVKGGHTVRIKLHVPYLSQHVPSGFFAFYFL